MTDTGIAPATAARGPKGANDALLLVAHGAPDHPDAARWLHAHAATLRAQSCFAEVAVGLLNGAPSPAAALDALTSRVVHVVPCFMEDGWFARDAVPRALGDGRGHALVRHPPLGVRPALAGRAAARVLAACGRDAAPVAVLLVGHGSARSPGRRMALHDHAARIAAMRRFQDVRAAFLSEPPFVADVLAEWRGRPVAVVGFFAVEGGHVRNDLPALLAAERCRRGGVPLHDVGIIVADPAIPAMILDLVAGDASRQPASGRAGQ